MEKQARAENVINNDFYDDLGEMWYQSDNHPIALLRAENAIRIPWVIQEVQNHFHKKVELLDIGCGAGFLTNALAKEGHSVTGVDLSENSLRVAQNHDATRSVRYLKANAYALPFEDQTFDAACAMDILEHVEEPQKLIQEASRILRPGGLFFFHTFNQNLLSYLLVIKGVDWFVKNAPKNMHVYSLFIPPEALSKICEDAGLKMDMLKGFRPVIWQMPLWRMLFSGKVSSQFRFTFSSSLATGYCGYCHKL